MINFKKGLNLLLGISMLCACKAEADAEPILPEISIEDTYKTEGNDQQTILEFKVIVTGTYKKPITVQYKTTNASSFAGQDYESKSGTLTFDAPTSTQIIQIVVFSDNIKEGNETFRVTLFEPKNATLAKNVAIGGIFNDDDQIQL